jgi:hypothetical protein
MNLAANIISMRLELFKHWNEHIAHQFSGSAPWRFLLFSVREGACKNRTALVGTFVTFGRTSSMQIVHICSLFSQAKIKAGTRSQISIFICPAKAN